MLFRSYIKRKNKKSVSLFEITINRNKVLKWLKDAQNKLAPKSLPKLSYWSAEFGLSDNEIGFYYQLTDKQIILKRRALTAHKSQNPPDTFPLSLRRKDFKELFDQEFLNR